jgi:hypothetical protein
LSDNKVFLVYEYSLEIPPVVMGVFSSLEKAEEFVYDTKNFYIEEWKVE